MDIETIKNLLEDILKDIPQKKKRYWRKKMDEFNKSYGLKINFDINDLGEDTNISKEEKEIKKAREIFDKMNETRISGLIEVEYPFPTQFEKEPIINIKEAVDNLNIIFKAFNENKRRTILYAIAADQIYNKVKSHIGKSKFSLFVSKTKFSLSWAKFLVKLYLLVENYPGLQQCALPLNYFQSNMRIINKYIGLPEYNDYWKNLI